MGSAGDTTTRFGRVRLTRGAWFAGRHFKASRFSERRTCAASSFRASISAVIFASSASPFFSILSSPMFAQRACVASARSSDLARAQIGRPEKPNSQKSHSRDDDCEVSVRGVFRVTSSTTPRGAVASAGSSDPVRGDVSRRERLAVRGVPGGAHVQARGPEVRARGVLLVRAPSDGPLRRERVPDMSPALRASP